MPSWLCHCPYAYIFQSHELCFLSSFIKYSSAKPLWRHSAMCLYALSMLFDNGHVKYHWTFLSYWQAFTSRTVVIVIVCLRYVQHWPKNGALNETCVHTGLLQPWLSSFARPRIEKIHCEIHSVYWLIVIVLLSCIREFVVFNSCFHGECLVVVEFLINCRSEW